MQQPYVWYREAETNRKVLISCRFEIPVSPLQEDYFLQKEYYGYVPMPLDADKNPIIPRTQRVLAVVYDWKPEAVKNASSDLPISFMDLVAPDSPYNYPKPTQMVDLISRLVHVADRTHADLYIAFALDSVYILNPSVLEKGDKHLLFRLCPHSVGLRRELPAGVTPATITRRTLAEFTLLSICRLKSYSYSLLAPRLGKAFKESPGLIALMMEVLEHSAVGFIPIDSTSPNGIQLTPLESERNMSNIANAMAHPESAAMLAATSTTLSSATSADPTQPPTPDKLTEKCSSAQCFSKLRDKNPETARKFDFRPDHVPALLSGMLCHLSPHIHTLAADGLWKLIKRAGKRELGLTVGVATECGQILVPGLPGTPTGLADPTSATKSEVWVSRMLTIDRVLYENEKTADYGRLRRLQQSLVEAGIAHQLGGSLIGHNERFTLKVLLPIVRVSTLMSFQYPNLAARLIFHRNVRRMSKMCIDGNAKGLLHDDDLQRYVALMLVISDFGEWIDSGDNALQGGTREQQEDAQLLNIWDKMDRDIFLLSALPAWTPSMSDKTSARIVAKFTDILDKLLQEYTAALEEKEKTQALKKVSYALDWHMQFAWNAPEQVSTASYKSLYTSGFMALITCKHNSTLLLDNPDWGTIGKVLENHEDYKPITQDSSSNAAGRVVDISPYRGIDTLKGEERRLPHANRNQVPRFGWMGPHSGPSSGPYSSSSSTSYASSSSSSGKEHPKSGPSSSSGSHQGFRPNSNPYIGTGPLSGPGPTTSSTPYFAPYSGPNSGPAPLGEPERADLDAADDVESAQTASTPLNFTLSDKPILRDFDSAPAVKHALKLAQPKNPSNPENLEYLMTTHKNPIKSHELASFAKYCLDRNVSAFYVPKPRGAPVTEESIMFNVPFYREDFSYQDHDISGTEIAPPAGMTPIQVRGSKKHSSLRSLMVSEMRKNTFNNDYKFIPITVAALGHPLCTTKGDVPVELGTTGMIEFTLADSGDLNRVMFGLTWDAAADSCTPIPFETPNPGYALPPHGIEYLVPGHSPTSVGFDISTGSVHYWDSTERKVDFGVYSDFCKHGLNPSPAPFDDYPTHAERELLAKVRYVKKAPYAPPVGTGAKVAICVAYDRVFLIIDSVFYPPIPNLVIPRGVKIHALLRFEAPGTKISQRCLTDTWRVVRNLDGALSDTAYNPLAHLMYLAELRTKVCPHYHVNRKPAETHPQLAKLLASEAFKALPDALKQRIDLIDLATRPCGADDCHAPQILNDLINRIISESRAAAAGASSR